MQQVFVAGDEPVPGYRLIGEIEGTAFYKVWQVQTPDGGSRSWKIIDLVVGNAAVETRTLGLLVRLRHPSINTLTNFWNLDDGKTLIIESELPKESLRQRLEHSLRDGKGGLSHEEVIKFLEPAAEGLDFLNRPQHDYNGQQVAIYHRSLRPESLLLFEENGQTVCKVSDFGLSKPVTEEVAQHSQGLVHYDYDPPEFFEGQTAPTSDQYALAVVYYELRTGQMPFCGTMLEQLQARLSDRPDLSKIAEPERSILRKALAREASHRYKSCMEMIQQLKEGRTPAEADDVGGKKSASGSDLLRRTPTVPSGAGAPKPTDSGSAAPGWRSPAAAMQSRPSLAEGAAESVTTTPPPGVIFHRPQVEPRVASASDSTLIRRTSPSDSTLLRRNSGIDSGLLRRSSVTTEANAHSSTADTTVGRTNVEETASPLKTTRKGPAKPGQGDLRSIREHLAATSFSMVDTYTGEKRIPLVWVAAILLVTAVASIYLANLLAS